MARKGKSGESLSLAAAHHKTLPRILFIPSPVLGRVDEEPFLAILSCFSGKREEGVKQQRPKLPHYNYIKGRVSE